MRATGIEQRNAAAAVLRAVLVLIATGWLWTMPALAGGPAATTGKPAEVALAGGIQEGLVSWYGAEFHDRRTASGERFDSGAYTMAHPTLPFGTRVRVTNLRNGRSVVVRVNDRGPNVGRRIADLSQAAASEIGMMRRGIVRARIEVLSEATVARD